MTNSDNRRVARKERSSQVQKAKRYAERWGVVVRARLERSDNTWAYHTSHNFGIFRDNDRLWIGRVRWWGAPAFSDFDAYSLIESLGRALLRPEAPDALEDTDSALCAFRRYSHRWLGFPVPGVLESRRGECEALRRLVRLGLMTQDGSPTFARVKGRGRVQVR